MKKICVITGATGGIGYDLCTGFHNAGYEVIALDYEEHRPLPNGIDLRLVDLRHPAEIVDVFNDIVYEYGTAHVLINNGAISHFNKDILNTHLSEVNDMLNVNLRGVYLCCQSFINANKHENYGRIINIASTRFHQNEKDWELYGATKAGVVALTSSLCVSLGDTPITVNAISPGWIQCLDYEDLHRSDHKQHPSGRVGKPDDILRACLFLADEKNDFINGHNLIVDGGMTKRMIYL